MKKLLLSFSVAALVVACGKDSVPSDVSGTGGRGGSSGKGSGGSSKAGGTGSGGRQGTGGSGTGAGPASSGGKAGASAAGGRDAGGTDDDAGSAGGSGGQATDSGAGGAPSDCFTNPTTHFEIINACTNAEKIDKRPNLPLLLPDGGLPALP